ncbi:MAG: hypothetical protein DME76_08385 [Verrucomicrobia bacterium]|nr:MAG: hypothetical protein DME76_08385 [Verrucomicrobiota bacterium]
MRDTVLKAQPGWRCYGYVIGKVNAPVGAGKDLLRHIGINDDRIHRNIRQVAGLVRPGKGGTVGCAGYLENMTGRGRRILIKAAYRRVTDRQIRGRHSGIQRDA